MHACRMPRLRCVCRAPPRAPCCSTHPCTNVRRNACPFLVRPSAIIGALLFCLRCAFARLLDGERLGSEPRVRAPCLSPASYRPRVPGSEQGADFGGRGSGGASVAKRVALATLLFFSYSFHDCMLTVLLLHPFSLSHRPPSTTSPLRRPFPRFPHPRQPPPHVNHLCHVDPTDDAFTILIRVHAWWRPPRSVPGKHGRDL